MKMKKDKVKKKVLRSLKTGKPKIQKKVDRKVSKEVPKAGLTYIVEVKPLLPILRTLPESYRISGYRKVMNAKEFIFYQVLVLNTNQIAASADVMRVKGKLYLDNLYVEPEHRNIGLASYLIDLVILNHQAEDMYLVPEMTHDENVSDQTLERFFSKFGFAVIDKRGTMMRKATPSINLDAVERDLI